MSNVFIDSTYLFPVRIIYDIKGVGREREQEQHYQNLLDYNIIVS